MVSSQVFIDSRCLIQVSRVDFVEAGPVVGFVLVVEVNGLGELKRAIVRCAEGTV